MELGVLGPLELVSDGVRVALGGPKQRLVLALLAARRGHVVGLDDLIDGLWPDGPQARPRKTVQVYVTRLRRVLGDQGDAIRSEAAGYRFDPGLVAVDADAFEADVQAALAEADDDRAVARLQVALRRWRGDAFGDLRDCLDLVPSAVKLDERRLAAMHELYEREVRWHPREAIAELEAAVEANPLHEGFAAQLMLAQYRVGRQADALATYRGLRRRLAGELGLEPGPAARELEGRILRHDVPPPSAPVTQAIAVERQRRRVTVVSVDIAVDDDAGLDPEVEMALVAPVRRAVRTRIVERGGVILGDGGDGISACFGYPSAERAVERAVLAALTARDLGDERVSVRVGVDTGVVIVEGGGDGLLAGIAGAPLRAATRLRATAGSGQVLLGATAAAAAADVVVLVPFAPGSPTAVAGALLDDRRAAPPADGLIGRDGALQELESLAARAASQFVPVTVSGPAGIGKTALVEQFAARHGVEAVWLHCDRRHHTTPLHPLRPVLPQLFAVEREPGTRAVLAALTGEWGEGEPFLVVDDVDAADPSTLDLLEALPEHLASGLVLLTTRSSEPLELAGEVVAHIALGPLDRAASREVAADVAGTRRLRLDTLNEIADRAGGVPLHVQVLTRAVLDNEGSTHGVPTSLYGSLMSVLDRLGPLRAVAQRLAVLGPSFDASEIDHVLGADVDGARRDVATMVAEGVLRHEHGRYRFASELMAETAYESLLHADRTTLHASVADAMTARGAPPERLAFHLEAAGRPFDAAVAWRRASADAVRRARHHEAIHHARRAVQILDRLGATPDGGETRRRALTNLAIGLQAISHGNAELLDVIGEARRAGVGADDPGRRLVLDVMEISALHERGDFVTATDVARRLVDHTAATQDDLSSAFALQFLGACHVWRGELAAGRSSLELAATLFESAGGVGAVGARSAGAMWSLLGLTSCFEDRGDAARLLDRARAVIPADDGYTRCLVAATAAMADQLADDPATVREAVEPIWSLAMDLGSDFWFSWAQALLGWAVAADDAAAGLAMLTETVDNTTTLQTKPYFLALLGDRLAGHGRVADGFARLDEGLAVLEQTDERLWEPLLRLTRARWMVETGDPTGHDAARAAVELAARRGQHLLVRRHAEWVAGRG